MSLSDDDIPLADESSESEVMDVLDQPRVRRIVGSQGRLTSCDESTVADMSLAHFIEIERAMFRMHCLQPTTVRLFTKLRQEVASNREVDPTTMSANEGHRLRCRLLLKFDTCRNNYADSHPELTVTWPPHVIAAMN